MQGSKLVFNNGLIEEVNIPKLAKIFLNINM